MIQSEVFWLVLAGSVVVYWLLPKAIRLTFLALVSVGYLASIAPGSVVSVLVWLCLFYVLVPVPTEEKPVKRQRWLPVLIIAVLGHLAYFKYIPPLLATLSIDPLYRSYIIPLGISYFTFKLIHYGAEVTRGNIKERSFAQFLCYMFLFPIFTAGPIVRFDHFLANMEHSLTLDSVVNGLTRIIHGLVKKLCIAELLLKPLLKGMNPEDLLDKLHIFSPIQVWAYLFMSFLLLYLDFSAYSDIAIGASRLFGIRVMENFNFPLFATNIGEFWKRWHMSWVGWCQSYIYMPILGLTRNPYMAVYATMFIVAIWHAGSPNYICWGLYHATGLVIYGFWTKYKRKKKWRYMDRHKVLRYAGIPFTLAFVSGGYVFTTPYGYAGIYASLRIAAKLFFVNLPA